MNNLIQHNKYINSKMSWQPFPDSDTLKRQGINIHGIIVRTKFGFGKILSTGHGFIKVQIDSSVLNFRYNQIQWFYNIIPIKQYPKMDENRAAQILLLMKHQ